MEVIMEVQFLLFLTSLTLTCASYPFESIFQTESIKVSKSPKELLNCMAKCVDQRVLTELESCGKKYPIPAISGIYGGKKRTGDYLVTMSKEELIYITKCLVESRDRLAQRNFDRCLQKHPRQVYSALLYCRTNIAGNVDNYYDVFVGRPEGLIEVYECIRDSTTELSRKEAEQEVSFENCAREVYSETCGIKSTSLEE